MNYLFTAIEHIRSPALLYFYLSHMILGERTRRKIQALEPQFTQINFYAIDVEQFPSLAEEYEVKSVPTAVIIKWQGGILESHQGYQFSLNKAILADI